jgi:signal transduction histidine kinase
MPRKYEALAALSRSALSGIDFLDLLKETVEMVAEVLQVPYCKVVERIPNVAEDKCLVFRAVYGWSPDLLNQVFKPGAEPHAGYTLQCLKPVVVPDMRQETRFKISALQKEHHIVSGLAVIIYGNQSAFGVLEADSDVARDFTTDEVNFMQVMAHILGIARERQQAEQAMVDYQQMLEQSNKDLAQFAMVASHDLQAPLRKIRIFAEQLEVDLQAHIQAENMDMLKRISASAIAMQELVKDLLELSKVIKGNAFTEVDLNGVVQNALATLSETIQQNNANIQLKPLCPIFGDSAQLERLFQNLIENAIKFQPKGQKPEVAISSEVRGNCCTINVTDNGIGFLPEHAERIFGTLERLHGKSTYEGTGVGLAICKRIVERHGGTIRALSSPGAGASFIMELPVGPPEQPSSSQPA